MKESHLEGPKKTKGNQTRQFIIDKTIVLLATRGYEQTSFQEIADLCGLSQAAPLYHFKSKEGLFSSVIESIRKNKERVIVEAISKQDDAFIRLVKYLRGHINWALVYRFEASALMLLFHFAASNQAFAETYRDIMLKERQEIEAMILAGQRENLFHSKQAPALLAEILHDTILGTITNLLAGRLETNTPRKLERKTKAIVEAALGMNHEKQS